MSTSSIDDSNLTITNNQTQVLVDSNNDTETEKQHSTPAQHATSIDRNININMNVAYSSNASSNRSISLFT
jgi:hypothetical protein